jgi:CarD family transcriptional regulator
MRRFKGWIMYQVGDKVVYPNHGVGRIESINEYSVGGQNIRFYTVLILTSRSTVKVPASNAKAVGLRELIDKSDIEEVFAYLRGPEVLRYDDWKERFKQNSDQMRTGKILDMAAVLKNLYFVSLEKPLSFREKRMYERSMQLIASEISEVRKTPTLEVHESLLSTLAKAEKIINK